MLSHVPLPCLQHPPLQLLPGHCSSVFHVLATFQLEFHSHSDAGIILTLQIFVEKRSKVKQPQERGGTREVWGLP